MEQFDDFFPNKQGYIKKKIVIKVSDYRSALIQGKFLAKKGLWVSEYRIESGLNCGGHAFATEGYLMGPILEEFKTNKDLLVKTVHEILLPALKDREKALPTENLELKITAQGGVGTEEEHKFLLEHYEIDSVGWGSPFLLVPEATTVDDKTLNKLAQAANITIDSYDSLCDALLNRIEYFHSNGCRLCDHGFEHMYAEKFTETEVKAIFKKKFNGVYISEMEVLKFQSALLQFLSEQYHEFGWVQQFHLGALRNNNSRMLARLGPDTGWDSIGDFQQASSLSKFLNTMDSQNKLTKTIIYNNNSIDNEMMAAMIGNFNDGSLKGKVQFGSGWWFMDQKDGMINQMNALSNIGLISCFIGMLTDSRSFLSFPRHEYFRRILCNLFGKDIQNGELPNDMEWIGKLIQDICYNNAKAYFDF
jgi:glucuronate isomerase